MNKAFLIIFNIVIDLVMDENISEEVENMQICFYDDLMGSYFIRRQLTDKKVQKYFDFNNF